MHIKADYYIDNKISELTLSQLLKAFPAGSTICLKNKKLLTEAQQSALGKKFRIVDLNAVEKIFTVKDSSSFNVDSLNYLNNLAGGPVEIVTVELADETVSVELNSITLALQTTAGISADLVDSLRPNIKIRLMSPYRKNDKFLSQTMISKRTLYSSSELSDMIREFEEIEKGISTDFSDLEKALYLYITVADKISYTEFNDEYNSSETLITMIKKRGNSIGFSAVYSELCKRSGIDCRFVQGEKRAWNEVEIDGKIFPVDIAWDSEYRHVGCPSNLLYFGIAPGFYDDEEHIPVKNSGARGKDLLSTTELDRAIRAVTKDKTLLDVKIIRRKDGSKACMTLLDRLKNGLYAYAFTELDTMDRVKETNVLYTEMDINEIALGSDGLRVAFRNDLLEKQRVGFTVNDYNGYLGHIVKIGNNEFRKVREEGIVEKIIPAKNYRRSNGTSFCITKCDKKLVDGLGSFYYVEFFKDKVGLKVRNAVIYSELDLLKPKSKEEEKAISDKLLSQKRVDARLRQYNGYVGFVAPNDKGYGRYIDRTNESLVQESPAL